MSTCPPQIYAAHKWPLMSPRRRGGGLPRPAARLVQLGDELLRVERLRGREVARADHARLEGDDEDPAVGEGSRGLEAQLAPAAGLEVALHVVGVLAARELDGLL